MKVTEVPVPPVATPVTIELDGEERRMLARFLYTLEWSSLPAEFATFADDLHTRLVAGVNGGWDPIKGAEIFV